MNRPQLALLTLLVLTACDGKDAHSASQAATTGPVAAPAEADPKPAATKPATKEAPKVTPEQKKAYRTHLRAGRKAFEAKKYADAVAEFEKALEAIPMDGRALSELGWAAFQAGDHEKARKANTDAVRVTAHPKVKAASLYNLGRVAEATGDKEEAKRLYSESLLLRPHDVVRKRLEGLGATAPAPGAVAGADVPCSSSVATLANVCKCLRETHADEDLANGDPSYLCSIETDGFPDDVAVARVAISSNLEWLYYVLQKSAQGWRVIHELGYLYEGGVAGVLNEARVSKVEKRKAGDRDVLWIEMEYSGSDSDMGINEAESYSETEVTLCVLAPEPRCPLSVPLSYHYERDILFEDEPLDDDLKSLQTEGLPIKTDFEVEVKLTADSKVSVVSTKGAVEDRVKPLLGTHEL